MTKLRKQRRALALLLSVILLFLAVPPSVLYAEDAPETVRILCNGEDLDSALLHEQGELMLTAETELEGVLSYGWEILGKSGKWVQISDKYTEACRVNYALVLNCLNDLRETQLRCFIGKDGERHYSEPFTVSVSVRGPLMYSSGAGDPMPISDSNEVGGGEGGGSTGGLAVVTIHYNFKTDSAEANPPSVLTYLKGTNVNRYVNSPNIVGYRPVIYTQDAEGNPVESSGETILVRFDNIQEDKDIYVVYLPTLVKYQVHHHRQNLVGDEYEADPFLIEEKTGYTGMEVFDAVLKMEGYKGNTQKSFRIAADGSTVVEVYYDRVYYHVDFNLDGGYTTVLYFMGEAVNKKENVKRTGLREVSSVIGIGTLE